MTGAAAECCVTGVAGFAAITATSAGPVGRPGIPGPPLKTDRGSDIVYQLTD